MEGREEEGREDKEEGWEEDEEREEEEEIEVDDRWGIAEGPNGDVINPLGVKWSFSICVTELGASSTVSISSMVRFL